MKEDTGLSPFRRGKFGALGWAVSLILDSHGEVGRAKYWPASELS